MIRRLKSKAAKARRERAKEPAAAPTSLRASQHTAKLSAAIANDEQRDEPLHLRAQRLALLQATPHPRMPSPPAPMTKPSASTCASLEEVNAPQRRAAWGPDKAFCPSLACPRAAHHVNAKGWRLSSFQGLLSHAQRHARAQGPSCAPLELLSAHSKRICSACFSVMPKARSCQSCRANHRDHALQENACPDITPANPPTSPPSHPTELRSPPPSPPSPAPLTPPPTSPPPSIEGPGLDTVLFTCMLAIKHIPIAARSEFAKEFAISFEISARRMSAAWRKFFTFSKRCLFPTPRPGQKKQRQVATALQQRLAKWRGGDITELWAEAARNQKASSHDRSPQESQERRALRALILASDGARSKAAHALCSKDDICFPSSAAATIMRQKRPPSPSQLPAAPMTSLPPPPYITAQQIMRNLQSFRAPVSPGASGMRHESIIDCLTCPSPQAARSVTSALTQFISHLASGEMPAKRARIFAGATLAAMGAKCRPIAMGEIMRKLLPKRMMGACSPQIRERLMPNQIGAAIQSSADAVMQCAGLLIKQLGHRGDLLMLKADLRNALSMLDRNVMLEEARDDFPGMSHWARSFCNQQPILFHGERRIASACGAQQGDPIASLLFCLGLHRIATTMREKCPDLKLNLWRMDDGRMAGGPSSIAAAIHIFQQEGPPLGVELRPEKCALWWPMPLTSPTLPEGLQQLIAKGASLKLGNGIAALDAPIGSDQYKKERAEKVAAEARECHARLSLLDSAQIELGLLRAAVGYPKMHCALRAADPKLSRDACARRDNSQRQAL